MERPASSRLPEALVAFGSPVGATEADIGQLAIVERGEMAARAGAVMPQRQRDETDRPEACEARHRQGEKTEGALHWPTMPPETRSSLRRKPKYLVWFEASKKGR